MGVLGRGLLFLGHLVPRRGGAVAMRRCRNIYCRISRDIRKKSPLRDMGGRYRPTAQKNNAPLGRGCWVLRAAYGPFP